MPLEKPEDFGTSRSGYRVNDYCHFCYRDGAFTNPGLTMDQMIDLCVVIMRRQALMPEAEARVLLAEVMPRMKRWREATTQEILQGAGRGLGPGDEQC